MSPAERDLVLFGDRFNLSDESLRRLGTAADYRWVDELGPEELAAALSRAKVMAAEYFPVTDEILARAPELRGIVVYGVGYNHVDVAAASHRGLPVANTAGANAQAVAELAVGLMLGVCRRIPQAHDFVRHGQWASDASGQLPPWMLGQELSGKTLGLVGLGNIGRRVARAALGLGMKVVGHDPLWSAETASPVGVKLLPLDEVFRLADVVSLHVPLTAATKGLVDARRLDLMRPGSILINASRGAVVDEEALVRALEHGHLAGAGLDVFGQEPLRDGPLLALPNVVLTPHIGAMTQQAVELTSKMLVDEILQILQGERPSNLVNARELGLDQGYGGSDRGPAPGRWARAGSNQSGKGDRHVESRV